MHSIHSPCFNKIHFVENLREVPSDLISMGILLILNPQKGIIENQTETLLLDKGFSVPLLGFCTNLNLVNKLSVFDYFILVFKLIDFSIYFQERVKILVVFLLTTILWKAAQSTYIFLTILYHLQCG